MDISLISPAGTTVTVSTDNGGGNNNSFNGTLFDADLMPTVTDAVYPVDAVLPQASPEGSFDNFLGQDPNGAWTLTIADDAGADIGTLVRWDLTIRTCLPPTVFAYCFGDGTGTACPCGPGAAGNGCPSFVNPAGANLAVSGSASVTNDTFVLLGSGMPTAGTAAYFQGEMQVAGGAGIVFGDGLRCADGTVIRLGTKTNSGGASQYPGVSDPDISVTAGLVAGDIRYYQVWYRSAEVFCTPATWNFTNGIRATWSP
jgi:hypothetical protein